MASGKDEDNQSGDPWSWSNNELKDIKAEHDRLMSQLMDSNANLNENGDHAHNPFSAFKDFVDSNMNRIYETLAALPSNIAEIRDRMQREQESWAERERDISMRWTGSRDSPDHIQMKIARSSEGEEKEVHAATLLLLSEAQRRNANVPPEKIKALFSDDVGYSVFDKPLNTWLTISWFKRDPYSPIRLEADPVLRDETHWRIAFEDLMRASLDKPLSSRQDWGMGRLYGLPKSNLNEPGLDWVLGLQCRGVLPPLLPRFHSTQTLHSLNRDDGSSRSSLPELPELLAWSHELRPICTTLEKDFSDLMSEVGTKSNSEHGDSAVRSYHKDMMDVERHKEKMLLMARSERESETEQDLYEQAYAMQQPLNSGETGSRHDVCSRLPPYARTLQEMEPEYEEAPPTSRRADRALGDFDSETEEAEAAEEWANLQEMVGEKRHEPAAVEKIIRRPDVLSALTTTRTTRLPDGTVTTEVVLKKRFSDGTETTEESVHTTNETLERQQQAERQQEKQPEAASSGKGWFWK